MRKVFRYIKKKDGFTRTPKFGVTPKGGGFTLIETMVAISLFLIIIVVGMGALLNSNLLHQKSRDMRSIMDSLSFIMEDMSRNLREGYNYRCLTGLDNFSDLTTTKSGENCWGVAFESSNGNKTTSTDQWVYYFGTNGGIEGIHRSTNGATTFTTLNSEEIDVDFSEEIDVVSASGFSILGAEPPPGDTQQPFIIIELIGTITSKTIVTPFYLQTSASQRTIDVVSGS